MLGCYYNRDDFPFTYDLTKNRFDRFQDSEIAVDLYRSNDIAQLDSHSLFIRPFVKVDEPVKNAKVLQFFLEDIPPEEDLSSTGETLTKWQHIKTMITKDFLNIPPPPKHKKGSLQEINFSISHWDADRDDKANPWSHHFYFLHIISQSSYNTTFPTL